MTGKLIVVASMMAICGPFLQMLQVAWSVWESMRVFGTAVSCCAKTAEPTEMPFGMYV